MNIILIITLFILLFINIAIGKELLFPGVIITAVFLFAALLLQINYSSWQYTIHVSTFLIILLSVFAISVGVWTGSSLSDALHMSNSKKAFPEVEALLKGPIWFVLNIILLIIAIYYAYHQYSLSIQFGNSEGIVGVLGTLRSHMIANPDAIKNSIGLNTALAFARAAGYVGLYLFIFCLVTKKQGIKMVIWPAISVLVLCVLSASRGGMIAFAAAVLFDWYVIEKRLFGKTINGKTVATVLVVAVIGMISFWSIGLLTGQSTVLNLWESLSIYAGSSLLCLDSFINQSAVVISDSPTHTFKGIVNMLNMLGADQFSYSSNHSEMVRWSCYSSNVYTAIYPYIKDFGIIGGIFFSGLVGIVFGLAWRSFNTRPLGSLFVITYGRFFGYASLMMSIAERLCSEYLAINVFVEVFFYLILITMMSKPKCSKQESCLRSIKDESN